MAQYCLSEHSLNCLCYFKSKLDGKNKKPILGALTVGGGGWVGGGVADKKA